MPPRVPNLTPARRLARQLDAQVAARGEHVGLVERRGFDKQIAFIRDGSKRKILFTPRRVGKTTACALYLLEQALLYPGRKSLFVGLSGEAAQRTAYDEVIRPELERMGMTVRWHGQARLLTLPNKSTIKFFGMDSAPSDQDRVLGGRYHLVIVDECQSYQQDMRTALLEKIGPGMDDYVLSGGGIIVLAGTPGTRLGKHFWYSLTRTDADGEASRARDGWKLFGWTVPENPHMAEQFKAKCEELRATQGPDFADDPAFRRQYLGEWVTDPGTTIYKFDERRNAWPEDLVDTSPAGVERAAIAAELRAGARYGANGREWTYVLACDLGWEDATAIAVGAYTRGRPEFFIVTSEKQSHIGIDVIGARLIAYRQKFNVARVVIDTGGGGRQIAESLLERYRLPIIAASKTEKEHHIAVMNSDFLSSRIVVIDPKANADLITEWQTLPIDRKRFEAGKGVREDERGENHLCDAALYCWRDSKHHMMVSAEKEAPPDDFAQQLIERMRASSSLRRVGADRLEQSEIRRDERAAARDIVLRFRAGGGAGSEAARRGIAAARARVA